jgi:hypothetical protein
MKSTWIPLRPTLVWLALISATAATVWLGTEHPFMDVGVRVASSLALGLAFLKVYLIGQDFMEIRPAPSPLRVAFAAWILIFGTLVITIHAL